MGTLQRSTQHLGPTQLGPRRTQSHSCLTGIQPNQTNMWAHNLYEHGFGVYNSGLDPLDDPFHPFTE